MTPLKPISVDDVLQHVIKLAEAGDTTAAFGFLYAATKVSEALKRNKEASIGEAISQFVRDLNRPEPIGVCVTRPTPERVPVISSGTVIAEAKDQRGEKLGDVLSMPQSPVTPTRRQKRTWKRRLSRARNTHHLGRWRAQEAFSNEPFIRASFGGTRLTDIRAPWLRGSRILACACVTHPGSDGGTILDLWLEGDRWIAGNDDRSLLGSGSTPDLALDAWLTLRASLACEVCGDIDCAGTCSDCGSSLCAGEAHDELCAIRYPSGPPGEDDA